MRIVVIGTRGQLAQSLLATGAEGARVIALGRPAIDLAAPEGLERAIAACEPDVIVNAAAYTAVDKAEAEPALAFKVNAEGAGSVAAAARTLGVPLVHVSTDYVFDGTKATPYLETDAPAPLGVYGASKLAGERSVASLCERHVIVRTAWVFSEYGHNFVKTMLRLATERPELRVVDDQFGCPTYAPDLAQAIIEVASKLRAMPHWGVYHACGSGETTWCGLARETMAQSAALGRASVPVVAITTADYPTPAKRPRNSRLDCTRLERDYGIILPDWRAGLQRCLGQVYSATGGAPTMGTR